MLKKLIDVEIECTLLEAEYVAMARKFQQKVQERAQLIDQIDLEALDISMDISKDTLKKWKSIKKGRNA